MDGLRQYVVIAVSAALICGIIIRLCKSSGSYAVVRMLCGLTMTIVLLRPISGMKKWDFRFDFQDWTQYAGELTEAGIDTADRMKREVIKQRAEAYILDKATEMDAILDVSVTVGDNGIPTAARIAGILSPLNKQKLATIIATELGIPKEQQEWTGSHANG